MTRSLTTAIKNELATNDIRPIHLITIGFSTPINITDCSFPLTSSVSGSSVTYSASDFIMGVSNHSEETDITKSTISLTLIADPFLLYQGNIENFEIQEDEKDSIVDLAIVSHWADFDKKNGRKTNNTSQQRFFSTDVGMDFASQTVQDIKWGRT
jgi:hypothetical protein